MAEEENGQVEEEDVVDMEVTVVTEGAEISTVAAGTDLLGADRALDLRTEGVDKKTAIGRVMNAITATSPGELNVTGVRRPNLAAEAEVDTEETGEEMIEEDMTGETEIGVTTDVMIVEETGGTIGVEGTTGGVVMEGAVVAVVAAMYGMVIGPVPNVASTTSPVGQNASNAMPQNKLSVC